MSFQMKSAQFSQAVREYKAAVKGKDMPYCLNRALRNVGFRAAEFTPKKDPALIEEELRKDKIALKFITKRLRARIGSTYETYSGRTRTVRRVTRKQIALRTRQFIARRKKRRGFLRAGWVAALINAGIQVRGLDKVLVADSKSKLGSGKQATAHNLTAYLGNGVWGRLNGKSASRIRAVMQRALARAMAFVAKDMKDYAASQMRKTAAKHAGKR